MKYNTADISTELILSHIRETSSDELFSVMQQSLDNLIEEFGNPEILPNDMTVISNIIKSRAFWFSLGLDGCVVAIAEKYGNLNFADLVFIVGMAYNKVSEIERRLTKNLLKKYFRRKHSRNYQQPLFPEITNQTFGLLIYREQAEKMIVNITGSNLKEASNLIRNLRKGDVDAQNYGKTFITLGVDKGSPREKVKRIWNLIRHMNQRFLDYKFALSLSWILYQIEYLDKYFGLRSWCATKNFAQKSAISLDHVESVNSLSLLKDINFNKYLWDMCMARLSECLTPSQLTLFENLSTSFESPTLTLKVDNLKIVEEIESFICESDIPSIFRDVYGNEMRLMYDFKA